MVTLEGFPDGLEVDFREGLTDDGMVVGATVGGKVGERDAGLTEEGTMVENGIAEGLVDAGLKVGLIIDGLILGAKVLAATGDGGVDVHPQPVDG